MFKTAAFLSLGCKVNSYETAALTEMFRNEGFKIVPFLEAADVYIINTCTVTHVADHKSRQMLHRARRKNPGAIIAAVGCYVECQEEILREAAVDIYTGNKNKREILALVKEEINKREGRIDERENSETDKKESRIVEKGKKENTQINKKNKGKINNKKSPDNFSSSDRLKNIYRNGRQDFEELPTGIPNEKTRVFLKIQDGCNRFCSYCIIPYARGPVRSRKKENILNEIRELAKKGYKEFVFTGIHLTSYGIENGEELCGILEAADKIFGVERIRLGSLEPTFITVENVKRMAGLSHICPHFHLSLQSGCRETLKRMNRKYTPDEFYECAGILRRAFENPAITTDIIVGFPGETEEEFKESLSFAEKTGFSSMHVFKYSKREGTPAAGFEGQVPEEVKNLRSDIMLSAEEKMRLHYQKSLLGKVEKVLFEEKTNIGGIEFWTGLTERYQKVFVPVGEDREHREGSGILNNILDVKLIKPGEGGIVGDFRR